ncbi:MAG: hypothetical protein C4B57_02370 [Deltaproteobacteria bacterium]|nr:MAG: hypothetical protein C4B57_02370 [Deltaproteobacteria bacterium]RKX60120.1 MAG: hypothetical protein DRP28_01855 [Thermodesulfobacteriota bacterium]
MQVVHYSIRISAPGFGTTYILLKLFETGLDLSSGTIIFDDLLDNFLFLLLNRKIRHRSVRLI